MCASREADPKKRYQVAPNKFCETVIERLVNVVGLNMAGASSDHDVG